MIVLSLLSASVGTIFWTSIAFIVVLFLLKKLAWKPMLNMIDERETTIEKSLKAAEDAKKEMASLMNQNEKLLAEARQERESILKDANTLKNQMIDDAKQTAEAEMQKVRESALNDIEREKQNAINDLKTKVSELSIQIAEGIIKKELENNDQQKELIRQHLNTAQLN